MVFTAVVLLTIGVALGTALALWHLRVTDGVSRPPISVGIVHGVIGAIGWVTLLFALRGPARGVAAGAGSFGTLAALLFAAALASGVAILLTRRKGPAITMAIHSGFAITGFVLLLAWNALG